MKVHDWSVRKFDSLLSHVISQFSISLLAGNRGQTIAIDKQVIVLSFKLLFQNYSKTNSVFYWNYFPFEWHSVRITRKGYSLDCEIHFVACS